MSVVSSSFRSRVRAGIEQPVGRFFGRLGLTPNMLTVMGFGIAVVAAWAAASQQWLAAGLLVAFGAIFDLFDGALARATNSATKFGAFMDSTFDRAGEAAVYLGIAWAFGTAFFAASSALPMAAMAAAFMVSYTRAKAESLGFSTGSGLASVGFAPREVRVVILAFGLIATGLAGGIGQLDFPGGGQGWLVLSLGLIAFLATVTTIQRIVFVYIQSRNQEVND
jgi:CDP-diacylglycerol--glycerol-3-phosphate 3-phosphatidyltransferase